MTNRSQGRPPKLSGIRKCSLDFGMRPATRGDLDFCKTLYVNSMKPLLNALNARDEEKIVQTFYRHFQIEEIRIILVDGCDAGWIQISETAAVINVDQIHLTEKFRAQGIGSSLLNNVMLDAIARNKPVLLSLIRGNPAIKLYQRLGFKLDGKDETKFHMRWEG